MASAASAMRSPALGPTMPQPMIRSVALVEQHLGDALVAAERQRAAGRRPREHALAVLDARGLGLVLGDPDPGDLGVGVGHRRDHRGVEEARHAGRDLGGDLALVHRLVRQHRLADDVADGEDVRHVGALLLVDRDEAALVDEHAGVLGADQLAVGPPPDRDQDLVEGVGRGGAAALEAHAQPVGVRPRPWSPWS